MLSITQFSVATALWMLAFGILSIVPRHAKLTGLIFGISLVAAVYSFITNNNFGGFRDPAGITAIGGVILLMNITQTWHAIQVSGWKKATAQILTSKVIPTVSASPKLGTVFQVQVQYQYWVEDRVLLSQRISPYLRPQAEYRFYDDAHQIVRSYPEGAKVRAFYNPSKPYEAYLEKQISKATLRFWMMGLIAIAIGIWWGFSGIPK